MDDRELEKWDRIQEQLRDRLCIDDDVSFSVRCADDARDGSGPSFTGLRLVAGIDISYPRNREDVAVAALVVQEFPSLKVVYQDIIECRMDVPYKAGYLAFREMPHYLRLVRRLTDNRPDLVPQVLFVDGNGILHPRRFGSACHIGVSLDMPTIGVAKNFLQIPEEGLTLSEVRSSFREMLGTTGGCAEMLLMGSATGFVYGKALAPTPGIQSPIFVSVGHRVSLPTVVALTKVCCRYRVPEPIRQADMISRVKAREIEQMHGGG